jgi:hypothetical protein
MISRRLAFRGAVAALALCAAIIAPSAQDTKPPARKVSLTTVTDEQITAPLVGLRDGSLELATEPPRNVSLLDLAKLTFSETAAPAHSGSDKMATISSKSARHKGAMASPTCIFGLSGCRHRNKSSN